MHVGALEARRWAGLVFAAGPDDGIGLRLAFVDPGGQRRDWDDWYWMVARVGPHAPDGSYARVEFDLGVEPSPSSRPSASTVVLEWSRREDAVALRATVKAPGRLEVIGDAPWGWEGRWVEVGAGGGGWRARLRSVEIAAAFSAGTRSRRAPDAGRGEIMRSLDIEEGATGRVAMVAVWGGDDPVGRAARLVPQVNGWINRARADWNRRRPRSSGAYPDLVASIDDNLMWTVLLQPETGRLYTPAGRRWIFPRPGAPGGSRQAARREPDDWTVFGWDSFFNAIQLATVSGELAWATLLAGTQSRYPNGNVPNWRSRRGGTPDRSQPPVGSFAALKLHQIHPDPDALTTAYPDLVASSDWWVKEKNGRPRREGLTPGLLSWGSDTDLVPGPGQVPAWEEGASGHQRAAWESGQDDLPLWDEAEWDPERQILAMSAVDLCSYRALDLECLSRIARILGDDPTAARLGAVPPPRHHHEPAPLVRGRRPLPRRAAHRSFLTGRRVQLPTSRRRRPLPGPGPPHDQDPARPLPLLGRLGHPHHLARRPRLRRPAVLARLDLAADELPDPAGPPPVRLRRPRRRPRVEGRAHVPRRPSSHGLLP